MAEKATKKPNVFVRMGRGIMRFFRDTRSEMKKIVWPNRKQVRNNFLVVAAFTLMSALFIFAIDTLFLNLIRLVMNLGNFAG